ncbi:integrin alpha-9-like isoform X2 [Mizuhopecten yessoensis]|uniref:Integrin alpha-9 n=1 Tax=Mizuhopecten yessoensis TaxID=6573 RepID=A0A210QG51_MIZYE|nr:integrin alpha-9-like isoform X2 [Mizuhopecten yessoensis]OWF47708.1 Integrin alpha-9 [Mizuhopecten yessoensis]
MATPPCVFLLLTVFVRGVLGFNLDTENFVIVNGPQKGIQFGFSSGMFHVENKPWILVGAPKSNSSLYPDIPTTGGLFRCQLDFQGGRQAACTSEVPAVEPENLNPGIVTYEQQTQLLGSNILINDNNVMICASKHKMTSSEATKRILYGLGRCNVGDLDNLDGPMSRSMYRKRPLVDSTSTYVYGMGLLGFSTASLKEFVPVFNTVMGAPGFYDGKGGFVLTDINGLDQSLDYLVSKDRDLRNSFQKSSYLGYSVGSGKFGIATFGTVVAGAPRYSNPEGHVGIVVLLRIVQDGFEMQTTRSGKQPGCGFGAALIVLDINGDGMDDLLVGSPFYTEQATDQGLVQVYYGTSDRVNILRDGDNLMGTGTIHGRFGMAMADIGDVNADGFTDVAIGAPYEDDQRGCIYIYNGNHQNMKSVFSQRITAKSLDPELRAFGFHISSPLDVDFNTYNDISVGAYMSDQAVILRGRPIVKLDRSVALYPVLVPLNPAGQACHRVDDPFPCLTYKICFNFTGRGLDRIDLDIGLRVDNSRKNKGKSSRMDLYIEGEMKGDDFITKYQIQKNITSCKTIVARVKALDREFFAAIEQPVEFDLNYTLSSEPLPGQVLPILDNLNSPAISVSADFNTGCGRQRCRSNLQIDVTYDTTEIIVGKVQDITISVNIKNLGEPAFVTRVATRSSTNVGFRSDQIEAGQMICKQNGTGMIDDVTCDFTTPFFQTMAGQFDLTYSSLLPSDGNLADIDPRVSFNLTATTESEETDPTDNVHMIEIPVTFKPDIIIYGSSNPEQATISPDSNKLISIEKTFSIYNRGPSPLPETRVTIEFPRKNLQGSVLVEAQNHKVSHTSSNVRCEIISSSAKLDQQQSTISPGAPQKIEASDDILSQRQSIQNMTCANYDCVHMECLLTGLGVASTETVAVAINITEASLTFDKKAERLNYVTTAEVHKPQHPQLEVYWPTKPVKAEIRVDIYPASERKVTEDIEIWILIVGCLGGLLLFVALGLLLWKCGFFKRKKREEVQAWKRKSGYNARRSQMGSARNRHASSSVRSKCADPGELAFLD